MKKIISIFLALMFCIGICGCESFTTVEESYFSTTVTSTPQTVIKNENTASKTETTITTIIDNTQNDSVSYPTDNDISVQLPSGSGSGMYAITKMDIDEIINELTKQEGIEYEELSEAKNTDTVTMVNLYLSHDEPMNGKFNEMDTAVMNALKNSKSEYIELGKIGFDKAREYATEFYKRRYYELCVLTDDEDKNKANYFISIPETLKNKDALPKKNYYQNIQKVIKRLEIKEGMLQKDAILKFNEYICEQVRYDKEGKSVSLDEFFEGKAICNSYAQVFELLCRTVGINCEFIGGTARTPQGFYEEHAWNKITFSDGTVYYFDTCWNDSYIKINTNNYQRIERYLFVTAFADRKIKETFIAGFREFS